MVIAVGGGSQAVGALTVARELAPGLKVYGAQAAGAAAIHDSWHARQPVRKERANTFAEGIATRQPYAVTFATLRAGLAGFVTVTDDQIAEAIRLLLRLTHNVVEGAGASGLAAALSLRPTQPPSSRRSSTSSRRTCFSFPSASGVLAPSPSGGGTRPIYKRLAATAPD